MALGHTERRDLRFVGLTDDDRYDFEVEPTAKFLVRERTSRDIGLHPWGAETPAWWIGGGARRLVVVFRSGWQLRIDKSPGFLVLARVIREARHELKRCPELGANAAPDDSPCFFLWPSRAASSLACLADWPVPPVVSEFVYVDAPGDWSMGHHGVRLYKQFDSRVLSLVDRYTLGAFQAMIDGWRGFDRKRLRDYTGPLVFPRKLLLAPRRLARS